MSQKESQKNENRTQYALNLTVIGIFGQVGFLTLVIIFVALFGGLWLDNQFGTKPLFTIFLLIISMPISLVLMYRVVMWATRRVKSANAEKQESFEEDSNRGA
jgi:F0F1-type ATP synthase assembly protein I